MRGRPASRDLTLLDRVEHLDCDRAVTEQAREDVGGEGRESGAHVACCVAHERRTLSEMGLSSRRRDGWAGQEAGGTTRHGGRTTQAYIPGTAAVGGTMTCS